MARARALGLLVALGLAASQAQAQLSVFDSSLFAQSVLQVTHTVEILNLIIKDTASWANVGKAVQVAADLQRVMGNVRQIAERMNGRRSVWSSVTELPSTTAALADLRRHTTDVCRSASQDGLMAQGLLNDAQALLTTLTQLVSDLQSVLGSVAGLQAADAMLGSISGQLAVLTGASTSANEGQLCETWQKKVMSQAAERVAQELYRDYGTIHER